VETRLASIAVDPSYDVYRGAYSPASNFSRSSNQASEPPQRFVVKYANDITANIDRRNRSLPLNVDAKNRQALDVYEQVATSAQREELGQLFHVDLRA
jgi:hypothetical protein